jgi:hypothetical protein
MGLLNIGEHSAARASNDQITDEQIRGVGDDFISG